MDDHILLCCSEKNYFLKYQSNSYSCVIGENGISDNKVEGDGTTPRGKYNFLEVLYRSDKINENFSCLLPKTPLCTHDAWCNDPNDVMYNYPVQTPYRSSYENLWREKDDCYDIIAVLNYNMFPALNNKGSAIFLHVANPCFSPTKGSIALKKQDLLVLLSCITIKTSLFIDFS